MDRLDPRTGLDKTPTFHRSFAVAAVFAAGCAAQPIPVDPVAAAPAPAPATPRAGESLAEADVIALALAQDPAIVAARAEAAASAPAGLGAGLYPNPSLEWEREHIVGGGSEREDAVSVSVPIELSGGRAARRHLAGAEVAAANARALRTKSDVVVRALDLFYGLIAEQQRLAIHERAAEQLGEAVRVVERRKQEGHSSGYDQARLEIEAQLATSNVADSRTQVQLLGGELAVVLGLDPEHISVTGDLQTQQVADGAGDGSDPPSLRALRTARDQARAARRSAGRVWIPSLAVSLGVRLAESDDTGVGYVAGLSVDLPVFSRGQQVRAEARAREGLARARLRAAERARAGAIGRARVMLVEATRERARFDEATRDRVDLLERAAESGYREGERSIVELLDARRARTEVELRRVELSLSVKRAEIALRAARGGFE